MNDPGDNTAIGWHPSPDGNPLRDRIAAAITRIRIQRDGDAHQMADAVIADLGLRKDASFHIHDREGQRRCTRYVTDWKADDE